jgi:hypothetical protein
MAKRSNVSSVLVCLLLTACSADDKGKPEKMPSGGGLDDGDAAVDVTAPSEGDAFLEDYAAAVCAMYEPCCKTEGLGYDAGGCTSWFSKVTAAYFKGDYLAEAASSCLSKLAEARAADAQRCSNVLDFNLATLRDECQKAFGATARDGAPPGGKCLLAADCARPAGGSVICYSGTCLPERRGSAGDGPCYISKTLPDEIVTCEAEDGLYCYRANNVCAPQVEDGELCPNANACKATARCIGGRCETLPGPGEACLNGIQGAGGFCRAGSACDRTTLICGEALEEGAACREPGECISGSCVMSKCAKPMFTNALNCTGKND